MMQRRPKPRQPTVDRFNRQKIVVAEVEDKKKPHQNLDPNKEDRKKHKQTLEEPRGKH